MLSLLILFTFLFLTLKKHVVAEPHNEKWSHNIICERMLLATERHFAFITISSNYFKILSGWNQVFNETELSYIISRVFQRDIISYIDEFPASILIRAVCMSMQLGLQNLNQVNNLHIYSSI